MIDAGEPRIDARTPCEGGEEPERVLGAFDLTCLGLNSVVGTGIFLTPGLVALHLGAASPAAFLLGGALCFAIALCFAELSGLFRDSGGAYVYAREAFGPFAGFLVGWTMWLSALLGGASVAVALGGRVAALAARAPGLGLASATVEGVAAAAVLATLGYANLRGVRLGALCNNLLAVCKVVALGAFVLWTLPALSPAAMVGLPPADGNLLVGFLLVLYTFSGFEFVPVPAGEVRAPQRNVPLALALVLSGAAALYVLVQGAVLSLGLSGSEAPIEAAVAGRPIMSAVIGAATLVAIASVSASIAFTSPRCLWVLAHDRWLPAWLAGLHPEHGTPARAIVVTTLLSMVLCFAGTFEVLAELAVVASLIQYLAAILGMMALRMRRPELPRPFRVPGGYTVPVLALLVCVLLFANLNASFLAGTAVCLAAGAALAGITRHGRSVPED